MLLETKKTSQKAHGPYSPTGYWLVATFVLCSIIALQACSRSINIVTELTRLASPVSPAALQRKKITTRPTRQTRELDTSLIFQIRLGSSRLVSLTRDVREFTFHQLISPPTRLVSSRDARMATTISKQSRLDTCCLRTTGIPELN